MSGAKLNAQVTLLINNKVDSTCEGDVLFTKYGVSGFAILDLSQRASVALMNYERVGIFINLLPNFNAQKLSAHLLKTAQNMPEFLLLDILSGLVPVKIAQGLLQDLDISNDAKAAMKTIGSNLKAFGGNVSVSKLHKYKYMVGMQTFNDPTLLATFSSFEEGLKIINNNLDKGKASTEKVYSVTFKTSKVAMFGVGLNSKEKGEAHFLPIIGEDHIAAMPYEIVLMDNKAYMLHGRFRIALHWPELTMGTFTKIMSTPGSIEKNLKAVCE